MLLSFKYIEYVKYFDMKKFIATGLTFCSIIATIGISAQPNYPYEPEKALLLYNDLTHFVEAYDQLEVGVDSLYILNTFYFDKASDGLKEYISRHQLTPELLMKAIHDNPDEYSQISDFVMNIESIERDYITTMKKYNTVLPSAIYPPTYLLVGANRGIAQASKYGQLVTITRVLDNPDKLFSMIVHELSHFQQVMAMGFEKYVGLYSSPDNMLGLCLREGGAEFITSLVLNKITQESALSSLNEKENSLKSNFLVDLKAQDQKYWLWESLSQNEHPKLLGYAIGYKICKSHYDNASDNQQSIREILSMADPDAFLANSGYFSDIATKN